MYIKKIEISNTFISQFFTVELFYYNVLSREFRDILYVYLKRRA